MLITPISIATILPKKLVLFIYTVGDNNLVVKRLMQA